MRRYLSLAWGLGLMGMILLPPLPAWMSGGLGSFISVNTRKISVQQHWGMYVPDPQRAHSYMTLTAVYADGREAELEESEVERGGWGVTWAGQKTRMAIWRYYAELHPKKRSRNRDWYLRGVCVREARRGEAPEKVVMNVVRRRFAPPSAVAAGMLALGQPVTSLVTVQYCTQSTVRAMIEQDRERRADT